MCDFKVGDKVTVKDTYQQRHYNGPLTEIVGVPTEVIEVSNGSIAIKVPTGWFFNNTTTGWYVGEEHLELIEDPVEVTPVSTLQPKFVVAVDGAPNRYSSIEAAEAAAAYFITDDPHAEVEIFQRIAVVEARTTVEVTFTR